MRKLLLLMGIILAMTVVAVPSAFAAENTKTGIVDFKVVIDSSEAGKKANAQLTQLINAKRAASEEKAKNVQSLKKTFEEQVNSLSAEDKKAKEDELNRVFREYQITVAQSNDEVQKTATELRNNLLKEIKEVLSQIAQEEKYSMIFDVAVVPYYDKDADISAKVIRKYNEINK